MARRSSRCTTTAASSVGARLNRPPGASTGLLLARADGERQARAVGDQIAGSVGLFLRVDDFDAGLGRLRAAGAELHGEPRDEPYGRVVVFSDVAGNRWDLLGPR